MISHARAITHLLEATIAGSLHVMANDLHPITTGSLSSSGGLLSTHHEAPTYLTIGILSPAATRAWHRPQGSDAEPHHPRPLLLHF
jgi:hypothetical protein